MPRLILPSSGGGRKLIRTLRAGGALGVAVGLEVGVAIGVKVAVDVGVGASVRFGVGEASSGDEGVGDSCATTQEIAATSRAVHRKIRNSQFAIRIVLNVVTPVHVWEQVIAPFAILQKFLIDFSGCELIVQTVEPAKMFQRSLGRVFPGGVCFHQERPIA